MQIQTGDYLSIHQIKVLRQLLYNGNRVSSIPVGYSISISENYNNMIVLLDSLNYNFHKWMIFGDLKLICTLVDSRQTFGIQSGYTKYPCFLCKWDTRVDREYYAIRIWPECDNLHPCSHHII